MWPQAVITACWYTEFSYISQDSVQSVSVTMSSLGDLTENSESMVWKKLSEKNVFNLQSGSNLLGNFRRIRPENMIPFIFVVHTGIGGPAGEGGGRTPATGKEIKAGNN